MIDRSLDTYAETHKTHQRRVESMAKPLMEYQRKYSREKR